MIRRAGLQIATNRQFQINCGTIGYSILKAMTHSARGMKLYHSERQPLRYRVNLFLRDGLFGNQSSVRSSFRGVVIPLVDDIGHAAEQYRRPAYMVLKHIMFIC